MVKAFDNIKPIEGKIENYFQKTDLKDFIWNKD